MPDIGPRSLTPQRGLARKPKSKIRSYREPRCRPLEVTSPSCDVQQKVDHPALPHDDVDRMPLTSQVRRATKD